MVEMSDCRLPKFLLDGKRSRGRPRKNGKACALEDTAIFAGFSDIDMDAVHIEYSEDACVMQDTPNTRGRPLHVECM